MQTATANTVASLTACGISPNPIFYRETAKISLKWVVAFYTVPSHNILNAQK
jgi:hypothetical protein